MTLCASNAELCTLEQCICMPELCMLCYHAAISVIAQGVVLTWRVCVSKV